MSARVYLYMCCLSCVWVLEYSFVWKRRSRFRRVVNSWVYLRSLSFLGRMAPGYKRWEIWVSLDETSHRYRIKHGLCSTIWKLCIAGWNASQIQEKHRVYFPRSGSFLSLDETPHRYRKNTGFIFHYTEVWREFRYDLGYDDRRPSFIMRNVC